MIKKTIILTCLLCMTLLPVMAQQYKTVLPYRIAGGKMIVEMKLNGKIRPFIFDTGASRTTLTGEICRELGITVTDSLKVTDANGHTAHYPVAMVESIQTPDNLFQFKKVPAMILAEPSPFACFQVDGLIGSDLFASLMLEIDGKAKTITIMTAEKESTVSLRKMSRFTTTGMPIINISTGDGHNINCLFDTGCPHFMSLKRSDKETLQASGSLEILAEGKQIGALSIGGQAATSTEQRVKFDRISIGATKFLNVITETSTPPYTLLGIKSLDYGKVIIDYPRGRFYFDAIEPENEVKDESHDIGLQVKDGNLIVAAVWGKMKGIVEMGDKILKINNKPVKKYDFCETLINGIPELKAKKKTKLTIQTRQGEKVIIY